MVVELTPWYHGHAACLLQAPTFPAFRLSCTSACPARTARPWTACASAAALARPASRASCGTLGTRASSASYRSASWATDAGMGWVAFESHVFLPSLLLWPGFRVVSMDDAFAQPARQERPADNPPRSPSDLLLAARPVEGHASRSFGRRLSATGRSLPSLGRSLPSLRELSSAGGGHALRRRHRVAVAAVATAGAAWLGILCYI